MKLNNKSPGKKLFERTGNKAGSYLRWALVTLAGTFLLAIILRAYAVDFEISEIFHFEDLSNYVEGILTLILAILASFMAAFLFAAFEEFRDDSILKDVFSGAPRDFYRDFVNNIAHYRGIIRYDHLVEVALKPHPKRTDIYLCDLTYSYRSNKPDHKLRFRFYRMRSEADTKTVPLIADECLENEFVWYNAEYDFPDRPGKRSRCDIEDYSLSRLEVGSIVLTNRISRTRADTRLVEYQCALDTPLTEDQIIKYRITIPIEKESIISVTSEFVTKNSSVSFDHKLIGKKINPVVMPHVGIKENLIEDSVDDTHQMSSRIDGWALPRNGWVIAWWANG